MGDLGLDCSARGIAMLSGEAHFALGLDIRDRIAALCPQPTILRTGSSMWVS